MRVQHVLFAAVVGAGLLFLGNQAPRSQQVLTTVATKDVVTTPTVADPIPTVVTPVTPVSPTTEVTIPTTTVPAAVLIAPVVIVAPMTTVPPKTVVRVAPVTTTTVVTTPPLCDGIGHSAGCLPGNTYLPTNNNGTPGVNGQPCADCTATSAGALYLNPSNGSCVITGPVEAKSAGLILDPTCKTTQPTLSGQPPKFMHS